MSTRKTSAKKVNEMATPIEETSKEISIPTEFKKENVPALIDQLMQKRKQLTKGIPETISVDIEYDDGPNVKNVGTVGELLKMWGSIKRRDSAYKEGIEDFNLQGKNVSAFKISGKSVDQWKEIIDKRIHEIMNSKSLEKLNAAITGLEKFLDEDTKLAREMANIFKSATNEID